MHLRRSSQIAILISLSAGLYFQIRDDYCNLSLKEYSENKSFCEDLTEGKFSFPIIHAIQTQKEDKQVLREYFITKSTWNCEILKSQIEVKIAKFWNIKNSEFFVSREMALVSLERFTIKITENFLENESFPQLKLINKIPFHRHSPPKNEGCGGEKVLRLTAGETRQLQVHARNARSTR